MWTTSTLLVRSTSSNCSKLAYLLVSQAYLLFRSSILTFTEPQACKANISGTLSAPLSRMHKSSRLLNRLFSSKMTVNYWPTMAIPTPASFRDSSARRRWMSLSGGTSVCHSTFSGVQFSHSFLRHLYARHYCALGRPRDPCSSD